MKQPSDIHLEPLSPEHAPAMFDGSADPAGYFFLPHSPPLSVEALRSLYTQQVAGCPDGSEKWMNWVIRDLGSGILVGYTQATLRESVAILGYQIFPSRWRQGFATSALRATLAKILAATSIQEVQAFVDTRNTASIALLRKLDFRCRRLIVNADHFKGASSDEHEFVLPREKIWLL